MTREKVTGAIVHKVGRNTNMTDYIYLYSINSITHQ